MRRIGAAGFKLGELEVTFFEPLPLELQVHEEKQRAEGFEETEDDGATETRAQRLERIRKKQLDADIHGSA